MQAETLTFTDPGFTRLRLGRHWVLASRWVGKRRLRQLTSLFSGKRHVLLALLIAILVVTVTFTRRVWRVGWCWLGLRVALGSPWPVGLSGLGLGRVGCAS
jgi:hypothetical protein